MFRCTVNSSVTYQCHNLSTFSHLLVGILCVHMKKVAVVLQAEAVGSKLGGSAPASSSGHNNQHRAASVQDMAKMSC